MLGGRKRQRHSFQNFLWIGGPNSRREKYEKETEAIESENEPKKLSSTGCVQKRKKRPDSEEEMIPEIEISFFK